MAFPIIRDPKVIHLFVDKFKDLLDWWFGDSDGPFFNFCQKNLINEVTLYDTWLLSSNSNYYLYDNFIGRARTENYIYEIGALVNVYDPATSGQEYLNYIINYNNFQSNPSKRIDRITLENHFWNLETSSNPLKNSSGYLISTIAGSNTANVTGGILVPLFQVGDMVKIISTGEYRQVLNVNPTTVTFDRPFSFSTTLGPSNFEIRDNKINETYAIDFETFVYRLKNIKNLASSNNLKVDAYIPRNLTQVQLLKIVQYFDKIFVENDYDLYDYCLYNDDGQVNTVRDVLLRSTQNRSGTIFINNNSDILHGTGTDFINELCVGGKIVIEDKVYEVINITNSTQAQINEINTSGIITNTNFKTYVEFLPIFHVDKTLRQGWMTTPLTGKSYADVFKLFTLSGFTIGSNAQPLSPTPVCYNLETDPSITGASNLLGLSVYGRYSAQSIDSDVATSSSLRSSATNPSARLSSINTTFSTTVTAHDCTCDNAVNGSATITFNSTGLIFPLTYRFTNGSRVIEVSDSNQSPFTFNGLGTDGGTYPAPASGTWTINISDSSTPPNTSSNSVLINESFQPTLTGYYASGPNGSITGNLIGGYQNYFIATLAGGTTNYDNVFFVSNLTDGNYGPGSPFNTLTPGSTYDFIIGDTDACIKIFRGVRIPNTPTGLGLSLTTTNPPCTGVNTGTITANVSGPGTAPYTYYFYPPTGAPIISFTNNINSAYQGTWSVVVVDSTTPTHYSAQSTVTLTNSYSPQILTPTNNQVCFSLQTNFAPYTIIGSGPTPVNQSNVPGGQQCFNNLIGGSYIFSAISSNGCVQPFSVVVPTAYLTIGVQNYIYPSCHEVANGVVNLYTLGGTSTPPIVYSATNGTVTYTNTTGQFNNLTNDIWVFTAHQGVVTATSVIQDLTSTRFNVFASSTGGTICISASGGSTGFYTIDINGTLYPYNTSLSANCYTATCRSNNVRVIDGDIINTNISGCVYTNVIKGNCPFDFEYTANTVTCEDLASIFVKAIGGMGPYVYTIKGSSIYNNIYGVFTNISLGTWEIIVKDAIGNSGSTIVNTLDNRLRFSASTEITGTCVTISNGLPPYYLLIDDAIYTATTGGTYCFTLNSCGYHGINVYDSCTDRTCANYIFTRNYQNPTPLPNYDLQYTDCHGVLQQINIDNTIGAQENICLILGSPIQYNHNYISAQLTGFCATSIDAKCYDDNSHLIYIPCPSGLTIDIIGKPVFPSCSGKTDGIVEVMGVGGRMPYVSYSAINGNQIFVNSAGLFNQLSAGIWTFYVQDSYGSIAHTDVALTNSSIDDNVIVSFTLSGTNDITMCVIIDSIRLPYTFQPPFQIDIYGNQFIIPTTDTEYCFLISGVTDCNIIDYTICGHDPNARLMYSFVGGNLGKNPYGSLLLPNNNILYGMTSKGANGNGLIFRYEIDGNYTVIKTFNNATGNKPTSNSLIKGSDGYLYGMTKEGGAEDMGTIFRCSLIGNLDIIYEFGLSGTATTDGYYPLGDLVEYSNGKFFGLTSKGGTASGATYGGAIFSCDTSGNYEVLYEFGQGNTGEYPCGSLILSSNGTLYGTTLIGGQSQNGTIFNFDFINRVMISTTFNTNIKGANPKGTLIEASDNYFYLTLSTGGDYGYGTLVKYGPVNTHGNTLTVVHHFGKNQDGKIPSDNSKLVEYDGKLYGTTSLGGAYNKGVIFAYNLLTSEYEILHSFDNKFYPGQGFLTGPISGYFYGMTSDGGDYNLGAIYRLNLNTITSTASTNVCCYIGNLDLGDLISPMPTSIYGDLISGTSSVCLSLDPNGGPYIVDIGGINYTYDITQNINCYEVIPYSATVNVSVCNTQIVNDSNSYNLTILHNFSATTKDPLRGVTQANDGNFYGVVAGSNNSILYSSNTLGNVGILYNFDPVSPIDAANPLSPPIQASNGLLYGGGYNSFLTHVVFYSCDTLGNYGIFDVTPSLTDESFTGPLIEGSDGNLYGTLLNGGSYRGRVFKLDKTNGNITFIHNFPDPLVLNDGMDPTPKLIEASDGLFYGMTSDGGTLGGGTIFRINSSGTFYEKIYDFDSNTFSFTNGASPGEYLVEYFNSGILYGVASLGYATIGFGSPGVVFSCDITQSPPVFSPIHIFTYDTFKNPIYGLCVSSNGLLYGICSTTAGGYGGIFSMDISGNVNLIYDFGVTFGISGKYPNNLMLANDGFIYGTAESGGNDDNGVLFRIDYSPTLTSGCCRNIIVDVPQCLSGVSISAQWINNSPYLCVTVDTYFNSGPYDVTIDGVTTNFNMGVLPTGSNHNLLTNCYPITGICDVISITICEKEITQAKLSGYTNEYMFTSFSGDGINPQGDLMLGYDGIFYGMTQNAGTNNKGTIFKFDPITKQYQTIHDFSGTDGRNPLGSLQTDINNILYGVTYYGGTGAGLGGGVLFSCETDGSNYNVMYYFDSNTANGIRPVTLPSRDIRTGLFYKVGTTTQKGLSSFNNGGTYTYDNGLVANNIYTIAGYFHIVSGNYPYFANPNPSGINVPTTGKNARGPQIYVDSTIGPLYGTFVPFAGMAREGGQFGVGTIYYNDVTLYGLVDIYNFGGFPNDGAYPSGGLSYLPAISNILFGMTEKGGSSNVGTIFKIDFSNPASPIRTLIRSFLGGTIDGANPTGSLLYSNGRFYGMTKNGGANSSSGIIFSFNPYATVFPYGYIILYHLGLERGRNPVGSLTIGSDGKLYGMTPYGGIIDNDIPGHPGYGLIFSIDNNLSIRNKCCNTSYISLQNNLPRPQITIIR